MGGGEGLVADHGEIMMGLVRCGKVAWAGGLEEGKCAVETAVRREDGGKLLGVLMKLGLDEGKRFRGGTVGGFVEREGTKAARRLLVRTRPGGK